MQSISLLFLFVKYGLFPKLDFVVVVVVFQEYSGESEEIESWPEILFDFDQSIPHLHQHKVAQPILV